MSIVMSVNAGSSSLKFQVFKMPEEEVLAQGNVERIGLKDSIFGMKVNGEKFETVQDIEDHAQAVEHLINALIEHKVVNSLDDIFREPLEGNIDVLIMAAFIHLFPRNDAGEMMLRVKKWLAEDGVIYLDTTEEKAFSDGEIQVKRIVNEQEIKYLRTRWTRKTFNEFIIQCGYKVISQKNHLANNGKMWLRTIIQIDDK